MILAAYMVVGFLVASIYAVGMLKGRRDRLHRLGLLIPLTIGLIATPIQLFVGDTAARAVADHQPAKFAGMECIQKTGGHQTEYLGGICTDDGVKAGDPDPRPRLLPGRLQRRHQGRPACNDIPADERPPANTLLHLAFDAMVGIGTALLAARRLARLRLVETARHPEDALVPARGRDLRRRRDPRALVRLDRHRGRPPALDRPGLHAHLRSGDRAPTASGSSSASSCSSTRRSARSRSSSCAACRAAGARPAPSADTPTALRPDPESTGPNTADGRGPNWRLAMTRADVGGGDPLGRGDVLRALRRRRLRRRLLGPRRRRRRAGRAAAGADPALADPRLGGQPRLADLHPRRPLDRLPARLQRRDDDALRAAGPGRGRDRPARLGLRLPQVDRGPAGAPRRRRHLRPLLASSPRSSWAPWSARSPPATCRRPATATPSRAGWSRCRC